MASAYGQRPSAILRVADEWAAWQLDLAALIVGRDVEAMLAKGMRIENIFALPSRVADYVRDPHTMVTRRVKIPESGIWE